MEKVFLSQRKERKKKRRKKIEQRKNHLCTRRVACGGLTAWGLEEVAEFAEVSHWLINEF